MAQVNNDGIYKKNKLMVMKPSFNVISGELRHPD
jgi:hypothetical protein